MKLYINKGHRTYQANIESFPHVEERVVGGGFGDATTVEREVFVDHKIDIDIPVGTALVTTAASDDPADVLNLVFTAFEEKVEAYERNNK